MILLDSVDALPTDSGAYVLWIYLAEEVDLQIGKQRKTGLRPGIYTYTGRASKNLRARLRRHLSSEKKIRWHVDKLLAKNVRIFQIWVYANRPEWECQINQILESLSDVQVPIPGFGASDCQNGCRAHLLLHPKIAVAETLALRPDWILVPPKGDPLNFRVE